jgi:hypothetical protein
MTNMRMICRPFPRVLKHVVGYRGHSVPYVGSQLLKIFAFDLTDDVLRLSPYERSNGVKSGDLRGQEIGAPLPISPPGTV